MHADADVRIRAFIAVDIPAAVKERIVDTAKGIGSDGIKVVGIDQIHITLFFLGYPDAAQIEGVKSVMAGLSYRKFNVSLVGTGSFSKRPRVVFAKVKDGARELIGIYDSLYGGLSRITELEERGFSPHATIARLKRFDRGTTEAAREFIDRNGSKEFGSFVCDAVRLKQSVLTKDGAIHSDICVKELG